MRFPLLLLICSLCSAQLQTESDNEVAPLAKKTEPQRREPTNASDRQQNCVQDIHAVVREMSIALAEQRVEIKHLQRENEGKVVCKVVREVIAIGNTSLLEFFFIRTCQLIHK